MKQETLHIARVTGAKCFARVATLRPETAQPVRMLLGYGALSGWALSHEAPMASIDIMLVCSDIRDAVL